MNLIFQLLRLDSDQGLHRHMPLLAAASGILLQGCRKVWKSGGGTNNPRPFESRFFLRLGLGRPPPKPTWSDGPALYYSTIKAEGQVFEKDSWSLAHETDQWHHYVQDWLRHNIAYEIVFTYLQCGLLRSEIWMNEVEEKVTFFN